MPLEKMIDPSGNLSAEQRWDVMERVGLVGPMDICPAERWITLGENPVVYGPLGPRRMTDVGMFLRMNIELNVMVPSHICCDISQGVSLFGCRLYEFGVLLPLPEPILEIVLLRILRVGVPSNPIELFIHQWDSSGVHGILTLESPWTPPPPSRREQPEPSIIFRGTMLSQEQQELAFRALALAGRFSCSAQEILQNIVPTRWLLPERGWDWRNYAAIQVNGPFQDREAWYFRLPLEVHGKDMKRQENQHEHWAEPNTWMRPELA